MRDQILALTLAALVALAGAAQAQTPGQQIDVLVDHTQDHIGDARSSPGAFAGNATNATWAGNEANWTRLWTCETAAVASEEGSGALAEAGVCPELGEDAAAGELEEEAETEANGSSVEELGNETATAVEDEVAAAEAFVAEVLEDPTDAPSALERFANRTLAFVHALLGLPREALGALRDLVVIAFDAVIELGGTIGGAVGDALASIGRTLKDAVLGLYDGTVTLVAETIGGVKETVETVSEEVAELTQGAGDAVGDAFGALSDAIARLVPGGDGHTSAHGGKGALERAGSDAETFLDGIELPLDF